MSDATPDPADLAAAVQQALDAAAQRHDDQPAADVAELLRAELARRDVAIDDDDWLAEAAGHLGQGRPVVVDDDPDDRD